MTNFLFPCLGEHHNYPKGELLPSDINSDELKPHIFFQNNAEKKCIEIREGKTLHTHYYVGVDWISSTKAVYVAPKLNTKNSESNDTVDINSIIETDFVKMLFQCLQYDEAAKELNELFEIKWSEPEIEINQRQDLLTPLLIIQFLDVLKKIVRKGLKKSYYKVEHNLNSKIKGRVQIGRTIKENALKNKYLYTYCTYEEFGLNGIENRLLKHVLVFVKRYLPVYAKLNSDTYIQSLFNYLTPAFDLVSEEIRVNDVKNAKFNPFYKDYERAIELAKLILKRFGYNISNIEKQSINTHPFWIDMSKLFELYVLGLLRQKFEHNILYHPTFNSKELDYLLLSYPMVIDAKYKPKYATSSLLEDMRQLSGYSRMTKVYETINSHDQNIIPCLIIYPNQECETIDFTNFYEQIKLESNKIKEYKKFYKIAIQLPMIKSK